MPNINRVAERRKRLLRDRAESLRQLLRLPHDATKEDVEPAVIDFLVDLRHYLDLVDGSLELDQLIIAAAEIYRAEGNDSPRSRERS